MIDPWIFVFIGVVIFVLVLCLSSIFYTNKMYKLTQHVKIVKTKEQEEQEDFSLIITES